MAYRPRLEKTWRSWWVGNSKETFRFHWSEAEKVNPILWATSTAVIQAPICGLAAKTAFWTWQARSLFAITMSKCEEKETCLCQQFHSKEVQEAIGLFLHARENKTQQMVKISFWEQTNPTFDTKVFVGLALDLGIARFHGAEIQDYIFNSHFCKEHTISEIHMALEAWITVTYNMQLCLHVKVKPSLQLLTNDSETTFLFKVPCAEALCKKKEIISQSILYKTTLHNNSLLK